MQQDPYALQEFSLDVGDGHTLYVQDWGNKDAVTPILFLHGGPGSQVKQKHKGAFDPLTQRVVFFDQRGCGKSTPYGELENNTTQHLVEDISRIADRLRIAKFTLHGSSWGSALALAYSLAHPDRVANVVIGGVYTGSKAESDWVDEGRFRTFYPEAWDAYLRRTPEAQRDAPTRYHFDKVLNGTPEEQKLSAYAYDCLESALVRLDDRLAADSFDDFDMTSAKIEMKYLANGCYMPDRYILDNAGKLTMPVYIVQGRYDMVCPPITAYELYSKLPNSKIYWTISGHLTEHEGQNIFKSIFASL